MLEKLQYIAVNSLGRTFLVDKEIKKIVLTEDEITDLKLPPAQYGP